MGKQRFSFKKHLKEGRYGSFEKNQSDIKLRRKVVGHIKEREDCTYGINFAVKKEKTEKDPAPFKWIRLKATHENEVRARDFINKWSDEILERYDLYTFED